jgi:two-component sensor histidine kinase
VIRVSFRRHEDVAVLVVADDGVGAGEAVQGTGMGSDLLRRLAGQLGGEFRRERGPDDRGTVVTVTIPVKPTPPGDKPQG